MINITFKNVGQGDSIIFEWKDVSEKKIGIIDCNLIKEANPTLDFIKDINSSSIEFVILSHPHYDHFSGMRQLLEYCESRGILIKRFLHTCSQVPDFLRVATRSVISNNELISLFKTIKRMRESGIIKFITYITNDIKDLILNDQLKLSFLSPSTTETDDFLRTTPLFDEEDPHNNNQANWLSTIIKIYTNDWYMLLTSDASHKALKRVGIQNKKEFNRQNLVLGQSPHHGAKGNHYDGFWKVKVHQKDCPIVFSVGQNIYNHPSQEAVDFFSDPINNYKIFSTNQTGPLSQFKSSPKVDKIKTYLDLIGIEEVRKSISKNRYQGDQKFSF